MKTARNRRRNRLHHTSNHSGLKGFQNESWEKYSKFIIGDQILEKRGHTALKL